MTFGFSVAVGSIVGDAVAVGRGVDVGRTATGSVDILAVFVAVGERVGPEIESDLLHVARPTTAIRIATPMPTQNSQEANRAMTPLPGFLAVAEPTTAVASSSLSCCPARPTSRSAAAWALGFSATACWISPALSVWYRPSVQRSNTSPTAKRRLAQSTARRRELPNERAGGRLPSASAFASSSSLLGGGRTSSQG